MLEVSGKVDLNTGQLDGIAEGVAEYEGHSVAYELYMEGKLSSDFKSAEGTLTNEDGEIFKWHATINLKKSF